MAVQHLGTDSVESLERSTARLDTYVVQLMQIYITTAADAPEEGHMSSLSCCASDASAIWLVQREVHHGCTQHW